MRNLLALGPELIAVRPNAADLLRDGSVRSASPHELRFVFDAQQRIDRDSLDGIQLIRDGFDGIFDGVSDLRVTPGYLDVDPLRPNEVVMRFAETLPDDLYRIEISAVEDDTRGLVALRNEDGDVFRPKPPGAASTVIQFRLNLGPRVVAVVPQPVTRLESGDLNQARNQIDVYFNRDPLDAVTAENPRYYELTFVGDTASVEDDTFFYPADVHYDADANTATLSFDQDIEDLPTGAGTYRLRVGMTSLPETIVRFAFDESAVGSSFDQAASLPELGRQPIVIAGAIDHEIFPLRFPGGIDEPGHRDIPVQSHFLEEADSEPGISTLAYNFQEIYGQDPQGNELFNVITPQQKNRARQIFDLYAHYLGVQFYETAAAGLTIVTGDIRVLDPKLRVGPGGVLGIAGDHPETSQPIAIMDNAELWDDAYGQAADPNRISWFETAMHEIGHLLGLGHTDELPPLTVMNDNLALAVGPPAEAVYPGDHDVVHGRFLHRPEANDLDVYRFLVPTAGTLRAETFAERLPEVSLLDSALSLYRQEGAGWRLVARNDDYFSEDASIDLEVIAGNYALVVAASGNDNFDPHVSDSGFGGTSDGPYELRIDLRPRDEQTLVDETRIALDGDADGRPGGTFDFWFRAVDESATLFVDKSADESGNGALGRPFNSIRAALNQTAEMQPGVVLRVVGHAGTDGNLATLEDNLAFEIGETDFGPLSDGFELNVPQGVTMMVDAGAVLKLLETSVHVGSSTIAIDRSRSALQVLGTPHAGVTISSYNDQSAGLDTSSRDTRPSPGDWGGLIFQNDIDRSEGRFAYEQEAIFLNYVSHADIRFGGGNIDVASVPQTINPIHLVDARPTVIHNSIRFSADAAMSANPDSFEESYFNDSLQADLQHEQAPGVTRIGPHLRGNLLLQNSLNGLFISIDTPAGDDLQRLTVAARWDDTEIVHIVAENLLIASTPGGPIQDPISGKLMARPDAQLKIDPGIVVKSDGARIEAELGTQLLAEGDASRPVVFTSLLDDRFGAGGSFATNNAAEEARQPPAPGNWGGIYVGPSARASLDHAVVAFAGGLTRVEGSFAGFNAIEVHQGRLRLAHSLLENNARGLGGQATPTRAARGTNDAGAIFVRGSQPIIVGNIITGTQGLSSPAINMNVNALNHELVADWGRSSGPVDLVVGTNNNQGPLVRDNRLAGNGVNGMVVRGGTLTTEGVWDDTDIVHVVFDPIVIPDYHSFGGLRLESSPRESLVVKLAGADAGFTATGHPLDIDDRIGGMLHVVGQPGSPAILTSLGDDSVGAGVNPSGHPQLDTDGSRRQAPPAPPGSFQIDVNFGPIIREKPQMVRAFQQAVRMWEETLADPITVSLDVEVAALPEGVVGTTDPVFATFDFDVVRRRMINDGGSHESLLQEIPVLADFQATLPKDPLDPFSIAPEIRLTRANARALGFGREVLPSVASDFDLREQRDALIRFNLEPVSINGPGGLPISFDYDRSDGIQIGTIDFVGVAMHEIGHALGFVSALDGGSRVIQPTPVDLFRLVPGDAELLGFAEAARFFDGTRRHVFFDGEFDPRGVDIPGLRLGDVPISTGSNNQASHWLPLTSHIGVMAPSDRVSVEQNMTETDRRAFDLIGWDVNDGPIPGDWRGITLQQFSHDRNVAVLTERERTDIAAPGNNAVPAAAQFLGVLGPDEKSSDDTLRLGFQVHGYLMSPKDVDVYSFEARPGTEAWFDIDRTTSSLDAVIELVDANGLVLVRSDNSLTETEGVARIPSAPGVDAYGLERTIFTISDQGTTNPRDPGFRVVLPGNSTTLSTYHVRVRSSGPTIDILPAGETFGTYQLQIRLQEANELPGSTVQYADIRYAVDGIRVRGLPRHSPLGGEVVESGNPNDLTALQQLLPGVDNTKVKVIPSPPLVDAQLIGNVLQSDRAAITVAGRFPSSADHTDWYLFEVDYDSVQEPGDYASLVFDLDYADGLSRANTSLAVYEAEFRTVVFNSFSPFPVINPASVLPANDPHPEVIPGQLLYASQSGHDTEDLAGPFQGDDVDDLSRGSLGPLDPLLGPISLRPGKYLLQVTSAIQEPVEFRQFQTELPPNPFVRAEPIETLNRVIDAATLSRFSGWWIIGPSRMGEGESAEFTIGLNGIFGAGEKVSVHIELADIDTDSRDYIDFVGAITEATGDVPNLTFRPISASAGTLTYTLPAAGATMTPLIVELSIVDDGQIEEPEDVLVELTGATTVSGADVTIDAAAARVTSTILDRPFLSPVPLFLGDVTLFIGAESGLFTADPFTGRLETYVGELTPVGDLALRDNPVFDRDSEDPEISRPQRLHYFSLGDTDANSGNYIAIDTGTAEVTPLLDDGILTFMEDPMDPGQIVPSDTGVQFTAMTFQSPASLEDVTTGYAVGHSIGSRNKLFEFDASTGMARGDVREAQDIVPAAGIDTQITELGNLDTTSAGGPGGDITGIAIVPGETGEPTMFAVTDTGGVFEIEDFRSSPKADYLPDSIVFDGVAFSGLTGGPMELQDGRFQQVLFALTEEGDLYATNLQGQPEAVFVDGQPSVSTGLDGTYGLAFGTVDQNMWHKTPVRGDDPGHSSGTSFYFGERSSQDPQATVDSRYYDFAGGAHGSLISEPFSLEGFSDRDDPALYFSYLVLTEQSFVNQAESTRDAFRVFIADDADSDARGRWRLLASNHEADLQEPFAQRLFDNSWQDLPVPPAPPGPVPLYALGRRDPVPLEGFDERETVWRQAKISLTEFVGSDGLRLRFDFSTAGSLDFGGAASTGGSELHAVAGKELRDGETFVIDGTTFEFDPGHTLVTPTGKRIQDGDLISVSDGTNPAVVFELDLDGQTDAVAVPIQVLDRDTAAEVAQKISAVILAAGPRDVFPRLHYNRVHVDGALEVTSTSRSIAVEGSVGVRDDAVPINIHADDTSDMVAELIARALADTFTGGNRDIIPRHDYIVRVIGHEVTDSGPLGLSAKLPGDAGGSHSNLPAGFADLTAGEQATALANADPAFRGMDNTLGTYAFGDEALNFDVYFEGAYLDDVIVGFASRGEEWMDFRRPHPLFDTQRGATGAAPDAGSIDVGAYQIEIRRASDVVPESDAVDPRDRFAQTVTLLVPAGFNLREGQIFRLGDGLSEVVFEFDSGDGAQPGNVTIPFDVGDASHIIAARLRDAINAQTTLDLAAASPGGDVDGTDDSSSRVNLFGNAVIDQLDAKSDLGFILFDTFGSQNQFRDQGQVIISSNTITHSAGYGIVIENGFRDLPQYELAGKQPHAQFSEADYTAHPGSVRHLRQINQQRLAPGISVNNNVIAFGNQGGIHFGGDPNGFLFVPPVAPFELPLPPIVQVADQHGLTQSFIFIEDRNNPAPPGLIPIYWDPTLWCPPTWGVDDCMGRFSAGSRDIGDAVTEAIRSSNLDVTVYRGRGDELFIEGATIVSRYATLVGGGLVPLGRFANNTIVGQGGLLRAEGVKLNDADVNDVGILIEDNARATLLNNIIVNFDEGVATDLSPLTNVLLGGTIFQGNVTDARNIDIGDFALRLGPDEPLFVDRAGGNFYPIAFSRAIDSSVDSLPDLPELLLIKQPLEIGESPLLAPDLDLLGQKRSDDPSVDPPDGFGRNVFKDRGAIDRVDLVGPTAQLASPIDNDAEGLDEDPRDDAVLLHGITPSEFLIHLEDAGASLTNNGLGLDATTVVSQAVVVLRDRTPLVVDRDYRFQYQPVSNQIAILPQAGVWEAGSYEIVLSNEASFVLTVPAPNDIVDGSVFQITDKLGKVQFFEFESGYALQVPQTLTLLIPADNSGRPLVSDGDTFSIFSSNLSAVFEFDDDRVIAAGVIPIAFSRTQSVSKLADAVTTVVGSADLGLSPRNLGDGQVHLGGPAGATVDVRQSNLVTRGVSGAIGDGATFRVLDGQASIQFEFDKNSQANSNSIRVPFTDDDTTSEIAEALTQAIMGSVLSITPQNVGNGRVHLGGTEALMIALETSQLSLNGRPGGSFLGADLIRVVPSDAQSTDQFIASVETAIASSELQGVRTRQHRRDEFLVMGAVDARGLDAEIIPAISDLAGNPLRANVSQPPFETRFLIDLVVDNPPVAQADAYAVDAGAVLEVAREGGVLANDKDPQGDSLTVLLLQSTTHGSLELQEDGGFVYVPGAGYAGLDQFTYVATDGNQQSNSTTVTIQVKGQAQGPVARADSASVDEDGVVAIDVLANDLAGDGVLDPASLMLVRLASHGDSSTTADGKIIYRPNADFFGQDSIQYSVADILGNRSVVTEVTVTIQSVNDAPLVRDDTARTLKDTPVTVEVVRNDEDKDGNLDLNSLTIMDQPAHGRLSTLADARASYTPDTGFLGFDSFTYLVRDNFGAASSLATVTIEVVDDLAPWRNEALIWDVSGDGQVVPRDALLVINELQLRGSRPLPPPSPSTEPLGPPPFFDVNGDNFLSPIDALLVLNRLNREPEQLANAVALRSASATSRELEGALDWMDDAVLEDIAAAMFAAAPFPEDHSSER